MHPVLTIAVKAARRAGSIITRASQDVGALKVRSKTFNDFVSEVDHAAERSIIETLQEAYPDHGFLGEESGADRIDAENVWIIDPLDGTTNFLHGFPQYSVSIALMQQGVLTQAVVYDPNRNDLFTATRGRGAFLNDKRIRVSSRAKLQESIIGTGFPFRDFEHLDTYLGMFKDMIKKTSGLRRPGSAALDLAYVAAVGSTVSGKSACQNGILQQVHCWCRRQVALSAILKGTSNGSKAAILSPVIPKYSDRCYRR